MRKPELRFWRSVLTQIGLDTKPERVIMVDDLAENICVARSFGINGIIANPKTPEKTSAALRNLLQDSLPRAEGFLKSNAGKHHSVVEGYPGVLVKDNFAQFMIWEFIGDKDIIYLKWPSGAVQGNKDFALDDNPAADGLRKNDKYAAWNYFADDPVLTDRIFPPDSDTTSLAYVVFPDADLPSDDTPDRLFDMIAANTDVDDIIQMYLDNERPRTAADVCCNVLRFFERFGRGSDPRLETTRNFVVTYLKTEAYQDGNRHYTTAEIFLYFIFRLYELQGPGTFRDELEIVKEKLEQRINVPTNPLALALRLFSCQRLGIDERLYQKDLKLFLSFQGADGGWPAGHFCQFGKTSNKIGNRGMTTALGVAIIRHDRAAKK